MTSHPQLPADTGPGAADRRPGAQAGTDAVLSGLSRAGFLRAVAASGVAAAAGPLLLDGRAAAASTPAAPTPAAPVRPGTLSPLDLHFRLTDRVRPFDLIAPAFVQVDERFSGAPGGRGTAAVQVSGTPATLAPGSRGLRLSLPRSAAARPAAAPIGAPGAQPALFRLGATPIAPYASVVVDVAATPSAGAAVLVGLVGDGADRVVARFEVGSDPTRGTVSIEVTRGSTTSRLATATADLTGPARYAFSVQENYVTALVGRTAQWTPTAHVRLLGDPAVPATGVDLRDPAVLRRFSYGYGAAGDGASISLSAITAGLFGEVGVRDPHIVTYADGTPYVRNGKLYFTATNAGLAFFQAAHWAVWRLDLADPTRLEHVAQLFFRRDGLVLGDHAGQIVVDDRDGGFHLAMSGWGDFAFRGVRARYARTFEDVLRGVHVIPTEVMPLPTTVSSWDPGMTRIGNRWYVSFVESPFQQPTFDFHPALARGPRGAADPVTGLTLVAADTSRHQTEGPILQKIGGDWYYLASDGDERQYRVYDLRLRLLGLLDAPYGTNIPHPMVVPVRQGNRTGFILITFDGTQFREDVLGYGTHGDFLLMRAAQTERGQEFPRERR